MKKVAEVETKLTEQEAHSLSILIQAVQIANRKGAFDIEDAVVIGTAKNNLAELIKKD